MLLRSYRSANCEEMAKLFYDTVHEVNIRDYTAEQVNAWADGNIDLAAWDKSFSEHYTVVAEENGGIAGFGDITEGGYLDRLYVHKDCQRKGIAAAICDRLESYPDTNELTVHASITAKPFFISRGYSVVKEQEVVRRGVALTNFVMKKCGNCF